ncbi:hypothetical protein [Marinibactrum halimedae]|uniref:Uncharacterized protein n=1 Tax=Marinibactrum halimedae TaxID=1444977 RepID=A0AA37TFY0_9GAMM|nr:hypothetical protein [Marinibactrum halimedae]MCD9459975.1 hypothetical protein [Marinibactrum halimedae]GLS28257.1 hypothetical protein GCM10007877_39760 [Marinibactrum halimedae]
MEMKKTLTTRNETRQHDAIDHLEEYIEQVDHRYQNLRMLWDLTATELRKLFHPENESTKH